MRRLIILPILLAASTAFGQGKPAWLLVGNKSEDSLSFVDVRTLKEVARTTTGRGPHEVAVTPDGKRALVPCAKSNELAVFDVAGRKELHRVSTGGFPVGVLIEPDGARAYVAYTADSTVALYDLQTLTVVGKIAAGKQADGMALVTGL